MKFSLKKIHWKNLTQQFLLRWMKHYKLLFFAIFLMVMGWGGYQWWYSLYKYHWNDEDRKAYLTATVKETSFHEQAFQQVLTKLDDLAAAHRQTIVPKRELFVSTKKETP